MATFIMIPHPCVVVDVLADGILGLDVDIMSDLIMLGVGFDMMSDGMIGVGVGMLTFVEIIVVVPPAISVEFVVEVAYVLAGLAVGIIDVVSDFDVDMLADENANGLAVVMTPLEFTSPSP